MTGPRTIIRNALLLDLDPPRVRRGELRVEMGIIVAAGSRVEAVAGDVVINAGGAVVMPGLVNGHTHLYTSLAVGMTPPAVAPRNFAELLQQVCWRLDRALDLPLIESSATVGALEALACGTTTLIDQHASPNAIDGSLDAVEAGLRAVGLRGVLCYETTDRNGTEGREAGLRENERYLQRCLGQIAPAAGGGTGVPPVQHGEDADDTRHRRDAGATPHLPEAGAAPQGQDAGATGAKQAHPRFAGLAGAHAGYTLSDDALLATADLARRFGVGVHMHVAQDPCDARICRERYGADLLDRLEGAGVLERPSILAHCTHLGTADLERLSASAVAVAHTPRSDMNNAVGGAPLLRIGRPILLGTDSIGGDMLAEAHAAWLRWRDSLAARAEPADASHGPSHDTPVADASPTAHRPPGAAPPDPNVLQPADFVAMLVHAARRASESLGVTLGRLEPGAAADLVVTDYVPATPLTDDNAADHLIFSLSSRHVRHVMVAGEWKLRERVPTKIDGPGYRRKALEQAQRLWQRMAELAD